MFHLRSSRKARCTSAPRPTLCLASAVASKRGPKFRSTFPIIQPLRIAEDSAVESTHHDFSRIRIDADLVWLMVSYHQETKRRITFINEAMAGALSCRKPDVVASPDAVATVAQAERCLTFERNDVFFLK